MVMGGVSDGTEYSSRERCARNAACPFPCRLRWHAGQSAIAGKGELTTGNAFRSLEHHAANSVRKSGMAQAIEDDLNDRPFSLWIITSLIPGRCRKAIRRARQVLGPVCQATQIGSASGREEVIQYV